MTTTTAGTASAPTGATATWSTAMAPVTWSATMEAPTGSTTARPAATETATGSAATTTVAAAPSAVASHIDGRTAVIVAISAVIAAGGAVAVPTIAAIIAGTVDTGDKRAGQCQYRQ